METVDCGRLGLAPGERVLDLGCGFGRHAYGALRRGADVAACDTGRAELDEVRSMISAMRGAGEVPPGTSGTAVGADARRLPFADDSFDRIIAAEILEHIGDDGAAVAELARVLRPGGVLAVTVPSWGPEKVCWMLSEDYHAPSVPDGHVRIYTLARLRALLRSAGLAPGRSHRAHALHTPYWWLRCAVGPGDGGHRLVRAYHRLLCWEIERRPLVARVAERLLRPIIGKSVVLYATKAARQDRREGRRGWLRHGHRAGRGNGPGNGAPTGAAVPQHDPGRGVRVPA